MATYYPSVVAHFRLRFDEAFNVSEQPPPESVRAAQAGPVDFNLASTRPLILESEEAREVRSGQFGPTGPGTGDRLSVVMNRVPKSASFELTGYRQAWKFNMTLDYRDLPIDPRVIRSCGVEIHCGSVDPNDFSTGMVRTESDGTRRSILRTTGRGSEPREDTLVMIGLVDSWNVQHTSRGSEISMEGRDLRGVFLDSPADPVLFTKLDLTQPIDKVVRQILDRHPYGKKMMVDINPDDWLESAAGPATQDGAPVLTVRNLPSPASKDDINRLRQGADGQGAMSTPQGGSGQTNFWDLIVYYCFRVGAVPYFVGSKLRLRPARSLYDQQKAGFDPAIPTPFSGGQTRDVETAGGKERIGFRRFVFGRDVAEMNFERKFTGVKARVVQVTGLDTTSDVRGGRKLVTGQWPTKEALESLRKSQQQAKRQRVAIGQDRAQQALASGSKAQATSVSPSGAVSEEEVLRISVAGIRSKKALTEIAKNVFEEVGRGEMGGSVHTRSLASFGTDPGNPVSGNADPDVVHIRPGDAVELLFDTRRLSNQAPLVSEATDFYRAPFDDVVRQVQRKLGTTDDDIARVIVASARGAIIELQSVFRVCNVKLDWSSSGLAIAFDFQNYIEARSNVLSSTGENTAPNRRQVAGGRRKAA